MIYKEHINYINVIFSISVLRWHPNKVPPQGKKKRKKCNEIRNI